MKRCSLRLSVLLSSLALLVVGSWWVWRNYYSGEQLHRAAKTGDEAEVERLLWWGADMNERDSSWGNTPLHMAATQGNLGIVKMLILAGADKNAMNSYGHTPLTWTGDLSPVSDYLISIGATDQGIIPVIVRPLSNRVGGGL